MLQQQKNKLLVFKTNYNFTLKSEDVWLLSSPYLLFSSWRSLYSDEATSWAIKHYKRPHPSSINLRIHAYTNKSLYKLPTREFSAKIIVPRWQISQFQFLTTKIRTWTALKYCGYFWKKSYVNKSPFACN